MARLDRIEGHGIRFRLVRPDDAAYIHGLRVSPDLGRYLSAPARSVEAQKAWILSYMAREAAGEEYYFVIERSDDGRQCGVVRLYDITEDSFTWGSWILDANKPAKAALASALLIYKVAFGALGRKRAVFDVRADNARTVAFHRRFGAVETHSDELNIYFELNAVDFAKRLPSLEDVFVSPDQEQSCLPSRDVPLNGA
jgi:RimJ/RimL family protein N-acetyltransferase